MFLVVVSCRIDFQSASCVGVPGHHVHRTWIPAIICSGATPEIVYTEPTRTLFRSCKRKLNCCWRDHRWHVAWHSWKLVFRLQRVFEVESSHIEHVFTWRLPPQVHKLSMEVSFHSFNMFPYPGKLRIYRTSKLLHFSKYSIHEYGYSNESNCVHEEIKSRSNLDNVCYHSVTDGNFTCCFMWVWDLVSHSKKRRWIEGVWGEYL